MSEAEKGIVDPTAGVSEETETAETTTTGDVDIGGIREIFGLAEVEPEPETVPELKEGDPEGEPADKPGDDSKGDKPGKHALSPEIQAAVDKRIGKEVAKRKDLEGKLQAAEARLASLETKQTDGGTKFKGILGKDLTVLTESELVGYEADIRELRRWARRHIETGYTNEKDGISFSAEEIADRMETIEEVLEERIPKARGQAAKRKEADERAQKAFPALFDAESPDHETAEALLKAVPELRRIPEYRMLIGHMIAGAKALRTKKPPVSATAPAIPRPGGGKATLSAGAIRTKPGELVSKFLEGGGTHDALIEAARHL